MKRKTLTFSFLLAFLAFACSMGDKGGSDFATSDTGQGGSLAGFTIVGDHLYTISSFNQLKVANISNPSNPVYKKTFSPGFGIETVFPRGNHLFLGSQTGMYIYDVTDGENPKKLSFYQHIYSCDPVVADERFAYVTMNSVWGNCGQNSNVLQIVDISDLGKPFMVFSKAMNSPRGLSIQNDTLIVCDNGLKVFKVAEDRKNISLLNEFDIKATDVISLGNHWLVIGDDGFYQYQIKNNEIKLLSSILKD